MLEDLQPPVRVFPCKVRELAKGMTKEDSKIFLAACEDKNWPIITLVEALRARGVEISPSPVTNHRKKVCSCSKI